MKKNIVIIVLSICLAIVSGYLIYIKVTSKFLCNVVEKKESTAEETTKSDEEKKEEIKAYEVKYSIVNESDYNFGNPLTYSYASYQDFIEVTDLTKREPVIFPVSFTVDRYALIARGYSDEPYQFKKIKNVKEFIIRTFQDTSSIFLVVLTNDGEVYVCPFFGQTKSGAERYLTPEEIDERFTKIEVDEKVINIKHLSGQEASLIGLFTENGKIVIDFK